jgi:hypothetical protein
MEIGPEHMAFYDEIKKVKEDAEIAAEKGPPPTPPLPAVGAWYIGVVILIFAGLMYWASSKVLSKDEKPSRKDRKKKKNT